MLRTLVNVNPATELRSLDELFEKMFASPSRPVAHAYTLPVDIIEQNNNLLVKAAVPGVEPSELEVLIENNVLTIRGETKHESSSENEKIYRREVSYGAFARSIRLPEGLDFANVDAEFKNGFVTITIPRVIEEKPKALKVNVRQAPPSFMQETAGISETQEPASATA